MFSQVLALSWSLLASAPAACTYAPFSVEVTIERPSVVVDHSQSRALLSERLGNVPFGLATQGLTSSAHSTGMRAGVVVEEFAKGQFCVNLQSVEVSVGYSEPPRVFVASEIPEGSCRYRSTLNHERRHVGFVQETSEAIASELRETLAASVKVRLPIQAGSQAEGQQMAMQVIKDVVDRVSARHLASERLNNLSIDTRASYDALSSECPG